MSWEVPGGHFWGPGAHFWSLGAHFGGPRAHCGDLSAHFGYPWTSLGFIWGALGAPWRSLGLILEPIGSIWGCLGRPKLIQSGPGWHLADIVKTYENCWFFGGFRGWRLPNLHQNSILEALAALPAARMAAGWLLDGWMLLAGWLGGHKDPRS